MSRKWTLPPSRRLTIRPAARTCGRWPWGASAGRARISWMGWWPSNRPPQGSRPSSSMRRSFSARLASKLSWGPDTVVLSVRGLRKGCVTGEDWILAGERHVSMRPEGGHGGRGAGSFGLAALPEQGPQPLDFRRQGVGATLLLLGPLALSLPFGSLPLLRGEFLLEALGLLQGGQDRLAGPKRDDAEHPVFGHQPGVQLLADQAALWV